jgi:uncharacterized membrane protein YvbJ
MKPPEFCPNCGVDVPRNALACPECGSDEKSGWSESANTGNPDLPDEEFDYDEFLKDEFGSGAGKPRGISWVWWFVAVILIVLFLLFCLH